MANPDQLILLSGTGDNGHAYIIYFDKAGLLSYADRAWLSAKENPLASVLGALKTIQGQQCSILSEPLNTPDTNLERVFIRCSSGRTILILHGKTADFPNMDEIYERIGDY
jgi:hypothetical protein